MKLPWQRLYPNNSINKTQPFLSYEEDKPSSSDDIELPFLHDYHNDEEHELFATTSNRHRNSSSSPRRCSCLYFIIKSDALYLRIFRFLFITIVLALFFSLPMQIYFQMFSTFHWYFSFWFLALPCKIFYSAFKDHLNVPSLPISSSYTISSTISSPPTSSSSSLSSCILFKPKSLLSSIASSIPTILILVAILINFVSLFQYDSSLEPPNIYNDSPYSPDLSFIKNSSTSTSTSPWDNDNPDFSVKDSYFVAINLYNSEHLFPTFTEALTDLVDILGHRNVFISIYESKSSDNTKARLHELDHYLQLQGVPRRIVMDNEGHKVDKEENQSKSHAMNRIKYLADVRNRALYPLDQGLTGLDDRPFKRVIWLNDVFFRASSIISLLETNDGMFDQACAFDYIPIGLYDSWVTHDRYNVRPKPVWPYFNNSTDISTLRKNDPIRVNSCWNGISVFDAKYFISNNESSTSLPSSSSSSSSSSFSTNDNITTTEPPPLPIRFRTLPECVVSECLLTSYDIHRAKSPDTPLIFMNPKAVATYDYASHLLYDYLMRTSFSSLWKFLWQDLISHRISFFSSLTEIGRKKDNCARYLTAWAKPPFLDD